MGGAPLPEPLRTQLLSQQARAMRDAYASAHPDSETEPLTDAAGRVVGRLLVDRSSTPWVLVDVTVLRTSRGAGVGTDALRRLIRAADAGGQELALTVRHADPAHRWYLAHGFAEVTRDDVFARMIRRPSSSESNSVSPLTGFLDV